MYSNDYETYHNYLRKKSIVGSLYRRFFLFPRILGNLTGVCLDLGCGTGEFVFYRSNTEGADINPFNVRMISDNGKTAYLIKNDKIAVNDGHYDSVLMDNVLEHIAEPTKILTEVQRILKPSGNLVIGVPGRLGFKLEVDHKVHYDFSKLSKLMEQFGFSVVTQFHTPFKLDFFEDNLKQYCLYVVFKKN